jgi:hypothetical protein
MEGSNNCPRKRQPSLLTFTIKGRKNKGMSHSDDKRPAYTTKRDEKGREGLSEDLDYRIKGLEDAKMQHGMTNADIAALDRMIAKLKQKKADKAPKPQPEKDEV